MIIASVCLAYTWPMFGGIILPLLHTQPQTATGIMTHSIQGT